MKCKKIAIFFLLVSMCVTSFSEEADKPNFNGPPKRFEQIQDVTMILESGPVLKKVTNQVLIGRERNELLPFWVHISGENLHLCSISGNAKKKGSGRYIYQEGSCSIGIRLRKGELTLTDVGDHCAAQHCAAPAVFGVRKFSEAE